jgi:hypothetical protein
MVLLILRLRGEAILDQLSAQRFVISLSILVRTMWRSAIFFIVLFPDFIP